MTDKLSNNEICISNNRYPDLCGLCLEIFAVDGASTALISEKGLQIRRKRSVLEHMAQNGCWLCGKLVNTGSSANSLSDGPNSASITTSSRKSKGLVSVFALASLSSRRDPEVTIRFRRDLSRRFRRGFELAGPHIVNCKRSEWLQGSEKFHFEIFAKHDDPAAGMISNRFLNSKFSETQTYEKVREWLKNCDYCHSSCRTLVAFREANLTPTRLLDISERDLVRVQSVTWESDLRYAALSYCWGQNQTNVLTSGTEQQYSEGMDLSLLPQTLRHAVLVTQALGLQYLWIDSLCIVQDSESDKAQEIGRMASIYSNAYITISASCVRSCHGSILHDRGFKWDCKDFPFKCDDGRMGTISLAIPGNENVIAAGRHNSTLEPIDSRAWAFQESFMSRRMLIFSTYQLFWVCGEFWGSDGGRMPKREYFRSQSSCRELEKVKLEDWLDIAQQYSTKMLSDPSDKLPALSSIASYFAEQLDLKGQYFAGMWRPQLEFQLYWFVSATSPDKLWHRPSQWRAPSWSFLSLDAPMTIKRLPWDPHMTFTNLKLVCSVVRVEAVPLFEQAPFGRIRRGASLRLRCRLWHLKPKQKDVEVGKSKNRFDLFDLPKVGQVKQSKKKSIGSLWYDTLQDSDDELPAKVATCYGAQLYPEDPVYCVPLYSERRRTSFEDSPDAIADHHWGIVLARLANGQYHRLGVFERTDASFMKEMGWSDSSIVTKGPEEEIVII